MKLEFLVNDLLALSTSEFPAAASSAILPTPEKDDVLLHDPTTRALRLGLFYEQLTMLLFGGEPGKTFSPLVRELDLLTRPDIVDEQKQCFLESKAICSGQHCLILDSQLQGYDTLTEHFPAYSISFALYRHSLPGIKSSWAGTASDLFGELSSSTAYLISLPYALVCALQQKGISDPFSRLVYRYHNPYTTFDTCVCIRSSTITRLATEPEIVIADLDLAGDRFSVDRYSSPALRINNTPINRFPIIQISDHSLLKPPEKPAGAELPF
ncbi:hypothetical protein J4210_00925 [Candidatus Woesearchaeota archaeon]|nr:hypothetical protein [Candidatus Woesearchaeota archaeon]